MQRLTDPSTSQKRSGWLSWATDSGPPFPGANTLRFFADCAAKKWPLRGSPVRVLIVMRGLIRLGGLGVFA